MKVRTFGPRPSAIRGSRSFRPEMVDLEERSLMSGDVGLAISQAEKPLTRLESNVFLTEATAMLVDSPLPDRLRARLSQQLQSGTLSREEALRQILRTHQFQAELIEDLTKRLLDRDPTASESLRLVRGVRSSGMDARWVMRQIMTRAEYLQSTDGSLAGFYQAATQDLLGRDATSEELAALAERPGGTGAVAHARILRDLMGTEEFALAQTRSVAARYISGSVTDDELDRFRQSYSGPGGHLAMLTQVLADASSNATGLVPTLEKNPLLSVKRVPGFLSGSITIPGSKNELPQNMAAPYDLFNSGIRKIDNVSVDYWMITLNKGDSIYLKAVHPENQTTDTDIALRIWGPDGKEIGKGLPGGEFSYVAGVAGTYILGISTKDNLNYRFEPTDAPTPSGATVHEFQAQFHVFPGPDTDTISIISNYRNTEYTDNGWRPWTQNEAAAYETLRKIASAGGDPRFTNFTDFRQVGDIDLPSVFDGWLTATWEPFDYMLGHRNDPNVVQDTFAKYHVIQAAFGTISSFDPVAQDFLHKQSVQDAYDSVHQLLADANEMRKNVESNFIAKFLNWATSNEVAFGDEPTDILSLMKNGLTEVQQKPAEVNQLPWIERLIGSIFQIAATAIGAISNAFLPGSGPVATLVASVAGNLISQCIDAWLEGRFDKPKPTPPPPSSPDITGAAIYMKDKSLDAYKNTFDLLTNTKFLTTKVFSNFGLLEALKTIQFAPSMDGDTVPADVLRKAYARASWEELLPRMFSWRRIDFNDPSSSVPKFTNFIPIQETARWEKPNAWWPDGTGGIGWNYYGPLTYPARDMASVWADARSQLTSLQGGTPFDFQGYDFTRSNGDKFDWFGPGNISPAIKLTGHTGHFYAVATDAVLTQPNLWRWNDQFGSWWWTTAKTTGVSIQEWSLQTPDGKGGYMELSQNAADSLFGRTPAGGLVPTGAGLQSYAGGSYLDFAIPSDGVVSRFEVFDSWGKDVKDFSPKTFRPEKSVSGKNVYFTPNPRNFWTNHSPNRGAVPMWDSDSQYSDFDLSFGVKSGALLGRTLNPRPVGPIPVPRPPARLSYSL